MSSPRSRNSRATSSFRLTVSRWAAALSPSGTPMCAESSSCSMRIVSDMEGRAGSTADVLDHHVQFYLQPRAHFLDDVRDARGHGLAVGVNDALGVLGRLVRRVDAGELLDLTRARFLVEALR